MLLVITNCPFGQMTSLIPRAWIVNAVNWCQRPIQLSTALQYSHSKKTKHSVYLRSTYTKTKFTREIKEVFKDFIFIFNHVYMCIFLCKNMTQIQCPQSLEDIRSLGTRVIGGGDVGGGDQTEVLRAHLSSPQSFTHNKSKEMNHKLCRLRF